MIITIDYIKSLRPCKSGIDNFEKLYPNYSNNLDHLLSLEDISYSDKIWLASRACNIKILQQWSVECAENVLDNYNKYVNNNNNDVYKCIQKTKDFLEGSCSSEDLFKAESAAWSAAESAAWSAESARSAAWSAAESAAWSAESARSAAESAWSAAWSAARSAAWLAAESARSAAEKEQESINLSLLIALVENEGKG